jgi:predicted outer membrane repeat protein
VYVDDDASGANDGSSWNNAFKYLQDALVSVSPAPSRRGDPTPATKTEAEIRVAQGTYKPHPTAKAASIRPRSTLPQEAAFGLVGGMTIKGGYAGVGAADPNERNIEIHRTILSGDLNGDDAEVKHAYDLPHQSTRAENSWRIVRGPGTDANAVLDGCVVTGATRGALENLGGSLSISHCVFTQNAAQSYGGAVYGREGNSILIRCRFVANWAPQFGGAVCADPGGTVVLTECSFTHNQAVNGGAVAGERANIRMTGCTFEGNAADGQGAIHCMGGTLLIEDCAFSGNSSPLLSLKYGDGGAIGLFGTGDATITGCLFERNLALAGGAIYSEGKAAVRDCVFSGNSAQWGGAIVGLYGSTVRNCVFAGNRAKKGGVAGSDCTGPEFVNCTFFANRDDNGNGITRGACRHGSPADPIVMTNCILWTPNNEVWTFNLRQPREARITFSDVLGGWPGEGNVDVDPGFANPGHWDPNGTPADPNDDIWVSGDYHLRSQAGRWDAVTQTWVQDTVTSPCIDAGNPMTPIGHKPFPNGGIINMGAYGGTSEASKSYFGGPVAETIIAGDINGDGRVDIADYNILALHWLEDRNPVPPPPNKPATR